MTHITTSQRERAATAILDGILQYAPDIANRELVLVLSRVVQLHQIRVNEAREAATPAAPPEERHRILAELREQEAREEARKAARRAGAAPPSTAEEPPADPLSGDARSKWPGLATEVARLRAAQPGIECIEAYRHFQALHGQRFLSYAGFRYGAWRRATEADHPHNPGRKDA